ncbi:MAG: matrixin family metalloprotease [Deltaproteobacteria bacterium]|nr:matrixin family metalloprotease [Deltaproteobacteria bacterium]
MVGQQRMADFSHSAIICRFKSQGRFRKSMIFGFLTLSCLALLSFQASATIVAPVSDPDMAQDAVAVITGHVRAIDSYWDPEQQQIHTLITLIVEESLKGDIPAGRLTIRQVGGVIGDIRSWVQGNPEFFVGEKVLLFLKQNQDGSLRVAHLYQGKYSILADYFTKEEFAYQATPAAVHVMTRPGMEEKSSYRLERFSEFRRNIRQAARARPARRRKPILGSPQVASLVRQSNEEFTLLGNARWFEPDEGIPVRIYTNQQGEPAAPTRGLTQIQQALAAWSNVPGSSFRYQDTGTTAAFGYRSDGVNSISFRDPLAQMDNPVRCGGILAQAGFFSSGQTRVVNGERFYRIFEGDVVTNDGWQGCGFYETPANFAEVVAHELGHVLGLGHSPDPNALMASYAHFDGRGASLGPDDQAGLRFIYPAAAGTPSPEPAPTFSLSASLGVSPSTVRVGRIFTVTMAAKNQGSQTVRVTPSRLTVQGTGGVSLRTNAFSAIIGPNQSRTFYWRYLANRSGTVQFTGSATSPLGNSSPVTSSTVTIIR